MVDGPADPVGIEWRFEDRDALIAAFSDDLGAGRAFVPGDFPGLAVGEAASLRIRHPESTKLIELPASVVWIGDDPPGVGLLLEGFDKEGRKALERFVRGRKEQRTLSGQELQRHLRTLSSAEAMKRARVAGLAERTGLERVHAKLVWEALLANSSISPPEVARIARMGTLPFTLLDRIIDNQGWTQQAIVRRALLSNPRLRGDGIMKVLRATPMPELKLMARSSVYPPAVRDAAKRLSGGG